MSALSKLETDVDLIMIRQPFSKEFYVVWNEALQLYRAGDWLRAKPAFEKVHLVKGSLDQPSLNFLAIMRGRTYTPPRGWMGIRDAEEDINI